MPIGLLIVYRLLGAVLLVLAGMTIWEKHLTVRGAQLLLGRIVQCRRASGSSPRKAAGGYRYLVEIYVDGERLELETNDSFWFDHTGQEGKALQVWYNPTRPLLERKSYGTELLAAGMALLGLLLLLFY